MLTNLFGSNGPKDTLQVTLLWANSLPVGEGNGGTLHVLCRVGRAQRRSTSVARAVNPEWAEGGEMLERALEGDASDAAGEQQAAQTDTISRCICVRLTSPATIFVSNDRPRRYG